MRRTNSVMLRIRAPSRGLVTRLPGESADLLPGQNTLSSALASAMTRAATAASNVRYEDGVVCNAPGYERVNMIFSLTEGLVAHWKFEETGGARFDFTSNHHDLLDQPGS